MNALKFTDAGEGIIEGLAIPFGSTARKDLDGEFFTKDTDLCLDWFDSGRPLLYHHGLDGTLKTAVIGRVKSYDIRDDGVWAQSQLDKASRYREVVGKLVDEGALGYSSGAMGHLVATDKKTGEIKRWPWVELSTTPTPSSPDATPVYSIKATDAIEHLAAIHIEMPEPLAIALKALDDWAGSESEGGSASEPYVKHGERVLADVQAFATRTRSRHEARVKADRQLSADDLSRLIALQGQLWAISADVDALIRLTDPQAQVRADEALQLLAEFQAMEARFNGVAV